MRVVTRPPSPRSRELFLRSVAGWAVKLKVRPREIRLRAMRRKWASCSTAGRLTFSYALLKQPAAFRRHVVVHELLHLRLPNHGRLFKQLLALYAPWKGPSPCP
jgi:hypothetical protein